METDSFNTLVSVFDTVASKSRSIPLSTWIDNVINPTLPCYIDAANTVTHIRSITDEKQQKALKKTLPGLVTGCHLTPGHDRSHDHIEMLTGWMQFDIDPVGNETVGDWDAIRDGLINLEYVAFTSLSVRGKGVWGLVKVKHPDRLHDHQRQFIHDMRTRFDITLDSTKGGNPTDLRFYSPDPHARIKHSFKIYDRLPEVNVIKRTRPDKLPSDVYTFAYNSVVKGWDIPGATPFAQGGYHHSIYRLCCMLNRLGVSRENAEHYIDTHIYPLDQITCNCISDPYQRLVHEHGIWSHQKPSKQRRQSK